jgi:hypothetical protein
MVMQRTRPIVGYQGSYAMPGPAGGASVSGNTSATGAFQAQGTGLVLAVALAAVVVFYVATRGIQGTK